MAVTDGRTVGTVIIVNAIAVMDGRTVGTVIMVNVMTMTNGRTIGTVIMVNAMAMTNRMTVRTVMIIKETTTVTDDAAWVEIDMLEEGMTVRLTMEATILMCDQKTGNIPIAMIIVNAMAVTDRRTIGTVIVYSHLCVLGYMIILKIFGQCVF